MKKFLSLLCSCLLLFSFALPAEAADKKEVDALIAKLPQDEWPEAPELNSEAAILVELNSGTIVYAKNATSSMYPASTTKILTALIAIEKLKLDDIITYSKTAIQSLTPGSSHIGLKVGDRLNVEDSLYGLLLPSANETANGLAELAAGSIRTFADLMNQKAEELGCVNSTFQNPNGLHDPDHMTCAYDLYRIMQACIQNETFVRISSSATHVHTADEVCDHDIPMMTTNLFKKKDSEYYDPDVICSKTGWTEEAGRCLVTYAKKDGLDYICVVMNAEAPYQYEDTRQLFRYGFEHFSLVRASECDTAYGTSSLLLNSPLNLPENPSVLQAVDSSSRLLIPDTISTQELTQSVQKNADTGVQTVSYYLKNYPLGTSTVVDKTKTDTKDLFADTSSSNSILASVHTSELIVVNVWMILAAVAAIALLAAILVFAVRMMNAPKLHDLRKEKDKHDYKFQ